MNQQILTQEQITNQKNKVLKQRDQILKEELDFITQKAMTLNFHQSQIKQISLLTATQLVYKLNDGSLSSIKIVCAYCIRAATLGRKFNLITFTNFKQAFQKASQCDKLRQQTKKKNWAFSEQWNVEKHFSPLFGIPISIKDTIDMNNFPTTVGLVNRSFQNKKDGVMLSGIRGSGMIPFIRTNVAQLAMTFDSNNLLWGKSLNPWDETRTPGGSSGGQAGLISVGGSPLGVGADIGGSIRIPSNFCGIPALKPGSTRLSFDGHTTYMKSFQGNKIQQAMGPFGKQVNDLALWLKCLTQQQNYNGHTDPYTKLFPFNDKMYLDANKQKLKIGYIKSLKFVQATQASSKSVDQVVQILKSFGHELVEIQIPNQTQLIKTMLIDFLGQGNMQSYKQMLKGEKLIPQYEGGYYLGQFDQCCFNKLTQFMKLAQPRVGQVFQSCKKRTCHQFLENCGAIKQFRRNWVKYLKQSKIQLVIMPGYACQAIQFGLAGKLFATVAYTGIWNCLDVPVGSLPIRVVQQNEEKYQDSFEDDITRDIRQTMKGSKGLPAGIQVIGLPYEEQRILGIMKAIQQKINFRNQYESPNKKK